MSENKYTEKFGKCPKCKAPKSQIIWGWDGVYYDLKCTNQPPHYWTYTFKRKQT